VIRPIMFTLACLLWLAPVQAEESPDPQLLASLEMALAQDGSFEDRYVGQVWLASMSTPLGRWVKPADENKLATITTDCRY